MDPGILLWNHDSDVLALEGLRRKGVGWGVENLRKDFSPATVIDVGVELGTDPLYAAFPDAFQVMIEPLKEFEPRLTRRLSKMNGELLLTAAGDRVGEAVIDVYPQALWGSSLLSADPPPVDIRESEQNGRERRTIPITTLDALMEEREWEKPFGLKIDAEGYEAHVIEGARNLLRDTQFVIAEVCVAKRFEDSYTFAQFVALMDSCGFGLCDLVDANKMRNGRLLFVDAVFTPS